MSVPRLRIGNFAQIEDADVSFGDLTLLIGPQATGKSLVLQLLTHEIGRSSSQVRRFESHGSVTP
jgi:predicted ATP-dependent endonuclease of OLD family